MSSARSEGSLSSYERFDIFKVDDVESEDSSSYDSSETFIGSDVNDSDSWGLSSDFDVSNRFDRFVKQAQLPNGWEERIEPETKECYFFDTNTDKVYYTLPSTDLIDGKNSGWHHIPGEHFEKHYPYNMRCRHILVKHNESATGDTYRQGCTSRSKEQALKKISSARARISNGEMKFDELARIISNCCSARNGGDLGRFKLTQMTEDFEREVLRLKIHELSPVFETRAGYHIVLRLPLSDSHNRLAKKNPRSNRWKKIIQSNENTRLKSRLRKIESTRSFLNDQPTDVNKFHGQRKRKGNYNVNNCNSCSHSISPVRRLSHKSELLEEEHNSLMFDLQEFRLKNNVIGSMEDLLLGYQFETLE